MICLGIDPSSTAVGLALIPLDDPKAARLHTVHPPKKAPGVKLDLPALTQSIVEEVVSWVGIAPDLVAIEEPFVEFPRAALPIAWICGGLTATFRGVEVLSVPHASWKRALCGRGNPDARAIRMMLGPMGYMPDTEHEASALGVALWAISRRIASESGLKGETR